MTVTAEEWREVAEALVEEYVTEKEQAAPFDGPLQDFYDLLSRDDDAG